MTYAVHEPLLIALGRDPDTIGRHAVSALLAEVHAYPKPGLVSRIDPGSHSDMDVATFRRSITAIAPFMVEMADAGAHNADMTALRRIGIAAEAAMMMATGGINTHRGAIFGLGLLCAAAGSGAPELGAYVAARWKHAILYGPIPLHSHGTAVLLRYGAGGARDQAARGFPAIYAVGLPALRAARGIAPHDSDAHHCQVLMALVASLDDTALLHRGGVDGAAWARKQAGQFLQNGGIGVSDWRSAAVALHQAFVARHLSPGGCADLLAMTLFVDAIMREDDGSIIS